VVTEARARRRDARCGGLLLALLVAVAFGGCGQRSLGEGFEGDKPPAPPTTAELSRLVAETRQPAYWLGARFRGITVSHASSIRGEVSLTYGPWTCDSGCIDAGGVTTGRRHIDALSRFDFADASIDPKDCWTRVGNAVAALPGCDPEGYPQELLIYAGTREILITSLYTSDGQAEIPARAVLRGLRPLNAHAPWPLQRPKALSCRDFGQVDRRYRRHMPQPLQPRSEC
jgi:hypothetical protein